jgi:hypothetical protein
MSPRVKREDVTGRAPRLWLSWVRDYGGPVARRENSRRGRLMAGLLATLGADNRK